ncbi:MAG: hypothetical protein QME64_10010, partial [bacterium]|nr:hypothetical protein [bacterium]
VGYLLPKIPRAKGITIILLVISIAVITPIIVSRAKLGERGVGTIIVKNVPKNSIILLDNYFKKPEIYHVLQGKHKVRVIHPPETFEQDIIVIPNQTVVVQYQPNK